MWILAEPAGNLEADNTEECLAEYAAAHLGRAKLAVYEYHGHLFYLESALVCGEFHLYLESISFKVNLVQFYGFQDLTAIALESGCSVMYGQAGNDMNVFGCEI